mmetsp:Transcript_11576/g.26938  ORF Transcript_11576/g.26938 Transcript_11576/m.26938 type:complete len:199 (-) Transcript_11576:122-718(-)|eukprot:CAMPEP_0178430644 /NCGR_PEP_ID=MMETSP0689_2-20121128/31429_1 /TAXON_ID=160604 /ORGANISM="Amphidinium massartii, Strain CS-259" /LENGTH=198 /DNA_ID=CAMNT_0020052513 /DNA_START=82 /DNA_END=678 /DNA_ORIENTATION=+
MTTQMADTPIFVPSHKDSMTDRQTSFSDAEESTSSSSCGHTDARYVVGPHDEPARVNLEHFEPSSVAYQYHPGEMLLKSVASPFPDGGAIPYQAPATIPRIGSASVPSVGSLGHYLGTCKPCAFATTKGCRDGNDCKFCHLCDSRERQRRKKAKRALLGAFNTVGRRPRNVMRSYAQWQNENLQSFAAAYGSSQHPAP